MSFFFKKEINNFNLQKENPMKMKYWNMIDDVVDASKVLVEDKPVAKAIIGTIDEIVEQKAAGINDDSVKEIVTKMAKSKWNDIKDSDLTKIADIIDDGVDVEFKTDPSQKAKGWLGKFWHYLSIALGLVKPLISNNEIKMIVGYVETIVEAKDHGISNEAFKDTLVAMGKSAWNNLDSDKIEKIMEVVKHKV